MAQDAAASRTRIVLGVVIALLVILLATLGFFFVRILQPPTLVAEQDENLGNLQWVRSLYGFGPSEEEQLVDPTSVAIAPNGRIYVTDPQRARVMVFNPGGSFYRLLHTGAGGIKKGQFLRVESLACDTDGNVYLADVSARKIIVFDSNLEYVREWSIAHGEGEEPPPVRGVYVRGNDVYVLGAGTVYKFDKQGRQLGSFGSRGRGEGQIDAYQGVAVDDKRVYIADALNRRVEAFDLKGKPLWMVPALNTKTIEPKKESQETSATTREYDMPQDCVLDGAGRLVTIDAFTFDIVVSDPGTGKILARYGTDGEKEGQFFYPSGIDYDAERDWFAVADTRNNRVQIVRIPNSGGSATSAFQRAMTSPYRYCAAPLLLLIVAAVIVITSLRRRNRAEDGGLEPADMGETS